MGLTQTKLHHRVLQENWPALCRRLQTEDGKKWVRMANPNGDYPLHLACYGGHAPPEIIRALIAAYPEALHIPNDMGFRPMDLACSNYRAGHPFRREVLQYLAAYSGVDYNHNSNNNNNNNTNNHTDDAEGRDDVDETTTSGPILISSPSPPSQEGVTLPDHTYRTSSTCVVCLERTADHVIIPCGHMCLCGDCAQKILQGKKKPTPTATATANSNSQSSNSAPLCCPVGRCPIGSIARVTMTPLEASNESVPQCIPAL